MARSYSEAKGMVTRRQARKARKSGRSKTKKILVTVRPHRRMMTVKKSTTQTTHKKKPLKHPVN